MGATAVILGPGEMLGGYRILDVIGIGGMGIVYRAEQLSLGREVALKVLAPALADDQEFRRRFQREGRNVAALEHHHIVAIHDSGDDDGRLFLAMRLVRGETLAQRLHYGGLTAHQALRLLAPIADALDTAHAAGIVHRDLKPQNILIGDRGYPYLTDFGVSKRITATDSTASGGFVGSHNYAAPEQVLGRPITSATDIYGLAAVLYECFTSQLPYARETDAAVLHAHVYEPPPTVALGQPAAQRFNGMMMRAMAKEPWRRFATAAELMLEASAVTEALPAAQRGLSPAFVGSSARTDNEPRHARQQTSDHAPFRSRATTTVAATERHPTARGRRLLTAAVVAVLVFISALVVTLGGSRSPALAARLTATAAPFTIAYTRPWRPVTSPVTGTFALIAGPGRHAPDSVSSAGGESIGLVWGAASLAAGLLSRSAPVPGGVPPALVQRYGRPTTSANVRIAGHPARAYTWSPTGRWLAAYVLPAVAGDAAIICSAQTPGAAASQPCRLMAQSASVSAAGIVRPGPDLQLARAIAGSVKRVYTLRLAVNGLAGVALPARAGAVATAARAELRAATSLRRLAAPARYRRGLAQLTAALEQEATALLTLAAAARSDDDAAYAHASTLTSRAGRVVESAAASVALFGFGLPRLGALRLPGVLPSQRASHAVSKPPVQATTLPASRGTSSTPPVPSAPAGTGTTPTTPTTPSTVTTPFS